MKNLITLLKPRILSVKNTKDSLGKFCFLTFFGLLLWAGIFAISLKVLSYFKSIEQLGDMLAFKLLSMILITLFSLMLFSSIITALSKLFLSRDLSLLSSMPVSSYKIYFTRWIESTIDSAWMVIIYTLPVFISYGIIFKTGPMFYISSCLSIIFLTSIASSISAILVLLAVNAIPANRLKNIFIFLGISLFMVLFIALRILRPERLVDPEVFATTLVYIKSLRTPASPFLPSTWTFDCMQLFLTGSNIEGLFHLALSFSCAGSLVFLSLLLADAIYFKGLSKADTANLRFIRYKEFNSRLFGFLDRPIRAIVIKEIKTFFRDQTQWSQIFLLGALILIYIYNFSVLPLDKAPIKTVYLQNILSFLNIGLASFVLTAISARFAYPSVSIEREAFWLIKSSPVSKKAFLWIKFTIYFIPLLILTEVLIISTNILLNVSTFMMVLSIVTILFIVPGVVSMGIGLGAAYPDFKAENPVQTVTSFGGFLFMVLCAVFIGAVIILESGPVYNIFMADFYNRPLTTYDWLWTTGSFLVAMIISILAIILPMRFGIKRLSNILT
ncbi:MAG: hypothetical protein HN737_13150 [Desulfobacterales bacterium]|jgi:ABC-2 type transport system permease protein|nr:hypothetical protein [Desulfobacteraceae bacterium]MBT7084789.1 hypothetical protein [Desulfobacterales bacterium]MBT7698344.1 hypothetical protein [Desulfobacterales bacterium]